MVNLDEILEEPTVSENIETFNSQPYLIPRLNLSPPLNRGNNLSQILQKKTILLTAMTVAEWILIGGQFLPTLIPVRNTISRS